MKIKSVFLLLFLSISCRTVPEIKFTDRDFKITLKHDGYERYFILHTPKNYDKLDKIPLLIALHGGGGTPKAMIALTLNRFNELADRDGFMVVYPEGFGKSWNDGRPDPISYAHRKNLDDTGFISEIINKMVKEYKADSEKIFVTGISNGGFMSIRISRELADKVKAVAPVCASIPLAAKKEHLNAPPMNIILINGTDDPLVPYKGGEVQVLGAKRGKILSTDETIEIFIKRNNCSDKPYIKEFENKDPDDGTKVIMYEYKNEKTESKVVLLKIEGGGHTWPGGWQYLGKRLVGKTSRDINACDVIWEFFKNIK